MLSNFELEVPIFLLAFMLVVIVPISYLTYVDIENDAKIKELAIKHRCDIIDMKNNNPTYGNCKGEVKCTQ